MLKILAWYKILYRKQITVELISSHQFSSDLKMVLHLYQEKLEVCSHKISVSAAVESCCQCTPLDWRQPELDWALSVAGFQEGKDTIFSPFPFTFILFPYSVFYFIPDINLCSGDGRDLEGGTFQDPIKQFRYNSLRSILNVIQPQKSVSWKLFIKQY